jgi:hypothetical protein
MNVLFGRLLPCPYSEGEQNGINIKDGGKVVIPNIPRNDNKFHEIFHFSAFKVA